MKMLSHTAECVTALVACWLGVRHAVAPLPSLHSQSLQSEPSRGWLEQFVKELSEALVSRLRPLPCSYILTGFWVVTVAALQFLSCDFCITKATLR